MSGAAAGPSRASRTRSTSSATSTSSTSATRSPGSIASGRCNGGRNRCSAAMARAMPLAGGRTLGGCRPWHVSAARSAAASRFGDPICSGLLRVYRRAQPFGLRDSLGWQEGRQHPRTPGGRSIGSAHQLLTQGAGQPARAPRPRRPGELVHEFGRRRSPARPRAQ